MAGKMNRSAWIILTEYMTEIEQACSDPAERWGMLRGVVFMKVHHPQREYMQKYNAKRRAEEKHGKDD